MSEGATNLRKNALLVGVAQLLSRVTGLLREIAFAAAFGAGIQADAYNTAFRIGSLFRELFAEGALANAFVPLYADVDEKDGRAAALALANSFLGVLLVCVGAVTLLTLVFAEPLVFVLASGFFDNPEKVELTAYLTRILSPFVATVSVASVFMGMLNVRGRFFLPSVAPVLFNGFTILACVFADDFGAATGWDPIVAVALAALLGGLTQALVQLPSLWKYGYKFRPTLKVHPALKRLIAFVVPAVVAISVVQVNLLIETQLASQEGDGPVSWLLYSFRLAHLPLSIVSVSVGVAGLASLSVLAAQEKRDEFRDTLAGALNLNSFLLAPAAAGLFLVAEPLVRLAFERGAFTPEDTIQTAGVLQMYAVALLGIGAHRVLVPVFYTLNDPRTPMWAGLATVALKFPVAWALMYPLGFWVQGLPLSHAVLVCGEVSVLLWVLSGRVPGVLGRLARDHVRIFAATAVMGAAVWWARGFIDGPGPVAFAKLLAVMGAGAAVYFVAADVLGLREGRQVLLRLLKRRPQGLPPTVDPDTQALLTALASGPCSEPEIRGDVAVVYAADRAVIIEAADGALRARAAGPDDGLAGRDEGLALRPVIATMRVGGGPPKLAGLTFGEASIRVDGDRVSAGDSTGPKIPVPPIAHPETR